MADRPLVAVVLCTAPAADAERLVDQLLDARLIACANLVGPVRSRYRWQGKVESADEMLIVMKAATSRLAELRATIAEKHPYDVPEVVELPVESGLPAYLEWVVRECSSG